MASTRNQNDMRVVTALRGHALARGPVSSFAGELFSGAAAQKPWAGGISTQCAFVTIDVRDGRHTRRGTWRGGV